MAPRMLRNSASLLDAVRAMRTRARMSAVQEYSPRSVSLLLRSAHVLAPKGLGRSLRAAPLGARRHARCPRRPQGSEPLRLGELLERCGQGLWVGVLEPSSRLDVRVIHDHVRMGDAALVVIVVDDCHLVFGEVLLRPRDREIAEGFERDAVLGVGRHDVVLVGAHPLPTPGEVVSEGAARGVHRLRPVELADALGDVDVYVVAGERAVLAREVSANASRRGVPRDGLEHRHGITFQAPRRRFPPRPRRSGAEPRRRAAWRRACRMRGQAPPKRRGRPCRSRGDSRRWR